MTMTISSIGPNSNYIDKAESFAELEQGLDFILNHFQEPVWPRTISTKTREGRQVRVYNAFWINNME
jgi:hypothetical protein